MVNINNPKTFLYDPLLPNLNDWPIVQLSKNRTNFIREVIDTSMLRITSSTNGSLKDELAKTLYLEKTRIIEKPWSVDPKDEKEFWEEVKHHLLQSAAKNGTEDINKDEENKKILYEIVSRYVHEMAGSFNIPTYSFAKKVLPIGFSRLLNASLGKNLKAKWNGAEFNIHDKMHLTGDVEAIRNLATKGTIIMVPTHFSNLDSIVMGWAIQTLGLPAFLYGAGLNLFGIKAFSYFMNRLGAYKVDRRRKNLTYLETLKTYSTLALHKDCHSLFFPSGARSRSGSIESKLKLGLLGTAMDAQFLNFKNASVDKAKKIFIVPVVINYHFVLEAPYLIDEYLKTTGREHYLIDESDKFSTSYEILKFLLKFFTASSDFTLSFGKGMDLFGNVVDQDGRSIDHHGREIDIRNYFISKGELRSDKQRDAEYIKMLGDKILESYHSENTVFTSHIVAFTAFEVLKKQYPKLDTYGLLRLPEEDRIISYERFATTIERLRNELINLSSLGKLRFTSQMSVEELIADGIRNVGIYHTKKVLKRKKNGDITTQDMKLLYYYHNRLEGYDLARFI